MKKYSLLVSYFITITIIFCCTCSFITNAQSTATFETITEALNYDGDKDAVKKLIITGEIAGEDYDPETSEWYKFRRLYIPFPNLEDVEILTSQDIPDWESGIFADGGFFTGAAWLKKFSAPNVKYVGASAFDACINLESVNIPLLEIVERWTFMDCWKLTAVDFPLITKIEHHGFCGSGLISISCPLVTLIAEYAFASCYELETVDFPLVTTIKRQAFTNCKVLRSVNLPLVDSIGYSAFGWSDSITSVSLGTGFKKPTEIKFDWYVFAANSQPFTKNIDLELGEFVLPKPDITNRIWHNTYDTLPKYNKDYVWKSINISNGTYIEEEIDNKSIRCLGNNIYTLENIEYAELYNILGIKLRNYNNIEFIDLSEFQTGVYFLQYINNKKIKTEKLIIY